ncbi:MAG: radical SAM family heme chaperone HemW [Candidatus Brocadiia bacterium]|jgi:oxygen-independent coproporphyrinogen-3 oxidase|nr:radical SAM family heme chaperone HemW [Candidatus Brocadiia bacterium]
MKQPVETGSSEFPDSAAILRSAPPARARGIYVHVPFCARKCGYCDFYSVVADPSVRAAFADRLIEEARACGAEVADPVRTVFVGGGTPTILGADLWRRIIAALGDAFDLSKLEEFTVETNPETVAPPLLETLAAGSVNRINIGAQSFHSRHLITLERRHEPEHVARAVGLARRAGVENISLDLIFGIPGETPAEWNADLDSALSLSPSHVSCYGLTYEPETPISRRVASGAARPLGEGTEAAMHECAIERLKAAGFEHYEISNFARPGRRCIHNMLYWTSENVLALGPGAAGHVDGMRWKNAPDLAAYLRSSGGAPVSEVERLDPDRSLGERLMLGLRLIEGAPLEWIDAALDPGRRRIVEGLVAEGLLECTATHLRLTRRGLLVADGVVIELL